MADISDFDPVTTSDIPQSKLAIFMLSTYGEGEPSDNMSEFWTWIGSTSTQLLPKMTYAAFGLGNSNYKHYNAVIDHVSTRLQCMGAQSILPIGKADDCQGQTEEHFVQWKAALFQALQTIFGFQEQEPVYEATICVSHLADEDRLNPGDGNRWIPAATRTNRSISATHSMPIKNTKELYATMENRNCIHMEIDLSSQPGLKYKTGDHLGVWPTNPAQEVERLLNCLGRDHERDHTFQIGNIDQNSKVKVPERTTLGALLTHYLEICAPLSREEIGSLVQFAPTRRSKELLMELCTDKPAYDNLLDTTYINIGRLLKLAAPGEAAWRCLPLSFIIETLPAMRPRYYSISSSSVVQPRRAAITAVVADKVLSQAERVPGLCTNNLKDKKHALDRTRFDKPPEPACLPVHIRKSNFKLPALSSHPIVMIAAGTGIAPFRAFLQERARLFEMGRPIGPMVFIFGCRNESKDYLYQDEIRALQATFGSKLTLLTAFSRPSSGRKMYVQDRVAEYSKEIAGLLIDSDANFYICGSASMARDVTRAVARTITGSRGWTEPEVQIFTEQQKRNKRWQQDVWG